MINYQIEKRVIKLISKINNVIKIKTLLRNLLANKKKKYKILII